MNKQQIQAKILDKISVATVWGKEGTQLYIGNIIYETIEERDKEILEWIERKHDYIADNMTSTDDGSCDVLSELIIFINKKT